MLKNLQLLQNCLQLTLMSLLQLQKNLPLMLKNLLLLQSCLLLTLMSLLQSLSYLQMKQHLQLLKLHFQFYLSCW